MSSIITQIQGFLKHSRLDELRLFVDKFFYMLILIILMIFSFTMGRLTKFLEARPTFTFESKEAEDENYEKEKAALFQEASRVGTSSQIVASKTGKKYYFVWCKGALNIKDSKKIYFKSEDLAQKAGYTLASNCN